MTAEGVSNHTCSPVYCGPSPASEPETMNIQNELRRIGHTLKAFLTLHSYGQMWMFPFATTVNSDGATCERVHDHDDLVGDVLTRRR